jgi:hypothetical protein
MATARTRRPAIHRAALVAAFALILAACGGGVDGADAPPSPQNGGVTEESTIEGAAPTVSKLDGIWLSDGGYLARFGVDGTFAIDHDGLLDSTPAAAGTYGLGGRTITFTSVGSKVCAEGDRWAWEAGFPEAGRLLTVISEDGSFECSLGIGRELRWTRVSPRSPAGVEMFAERTPGTGPPPTTSTSVSGIWLLQGSGTLLRLSWQGTYALDDGGGLGTDPDDEGSFEVDDRGTLTFTSGAESQACDAGDLWTWRKVQFGAGKLRGVVSEDECRNDVGVDQTWFLLSS